MGWLHHTALFLAGLGLVCVVIQGWVFQNPYLDRATLYLILGSMFVEMVGTVARVFEQYRR